MRYEYIDPLVASTISVLDSVIQSDISKGRVSLVNGNGIHGDIAIVIKVMNDSEGSFILSMETETALKVCGLMNGETFDSLTPFGMDSIAELANMIAGNATSTLANMGFKFNVSIPHVVIKEEFRNRIPAIETFQVPLFTECGEITINVALRTN